MKEKGLIIVLSAFAVLSLCGCGMFSSVKTVGKNITHEDITEFWYTESSSAYPPDFQRYHFYRENEDWLFYHEKREGNVWPLTEAYITDSGTLVLNEKQKSELFELVDHGTVRKRSENTSAGSGGPWLYLYWKKDRSLEQEFSFESLRKQNDFVLFCEKLKDEEMTLHALSSD